MTWHAVVRSILILFLKTLDAFVFGIVDFTTGIVDLFSLSFCLPLSDLVSTSNTSLFSVSLISTVFLKFLFLQI